MKGFRCHDQGPSPYQYQYPMDQQRPYRNGNYVNTRIQSNKNGVKKTTRRKQSNRNKTKTSGSSTTESAWLDDFLDKRRQMNTQTNLQQTKATKTAKKDKTDDSS